MSDRIQSVAIVGGGFSGAMLAARLAERGVASTMIDRTGTFGLGVAYSTTFDGHVLNVRSDRMSALDGRPEDFVRWLQADHPDQADPEGFAPRRLYGLYVQDRLASVEAAHPGLITRLVGEAVGIDDGTVWVEDGRSVEADAVVLATGNPAPKTAEPTRGEAPGRVIGDPWAPRALERIGPADDVIVLGVGLTMVDVMLWLEARGWRGQAVALSRHGLKPRPHGTRPDAAVPPTDELLNAAPSRRLAEARRLADGNDWRGVMEGLRPVTANLWAQSDDATRARLMRHLRPWWNVHRHRIPAGVATALDRLEADGRLRVVAGRVLRIDQDANGATLIWRARGGEEATPLTGGWLIDCTGPWHDPATDPLTGPLISSGRARQDTLALGLDLDSRGRVLDTAGRPDARLLVLGPPARGAFWETTAVPDIRKRIEDMARVLTET